MRSARGRDRRSAGAGSCACVVALVACLCLGAPAGAQPNVQVDQGVLDSLGPAPPAKKPAARPPAAKATPTPPKKNETAAAAKPVPPPPAPTLAPLPTPSAAPPPPPTRPAESPQAVEAPQAEPAIPPASEFVVRPVPPPPPLPPAPRAPEAPSIAATAALPPVGPTSGETARQIAFAGDDVEISPEARSELDALAARLTDNERLHVDLLGYAAATSEPSQSRRLSLSRALAVRSYLVGRGIKSNRVDVRALGNRVDGTPTDRVDVVVAER